MEGLHGFHDEQVMSSRAPGAGRSVRRGAPERIRLPGRARAARRPRILVYTSGRRGPKGAMLSTATSSSSSATRTSHDAEGGRPAALVPAALPHRRADVHVFYPLRTGATVNFAESIDTVPDNVREVAPAVFFAVARIWEKFTRAGAAHARATWIGKVAYRWAIGVGMRMAERRVRGERPGLGLRLLTGSRTSSCSTTSALDRHDGCAAPRRRAARSRPSSSSGSWRSASTCARSTGRPRTAGSRPPCRTIASSRHGRTARPDTEMRISPRARSCSAAARLHGVLQQPAEDRGDDRDGWLHTGDVGVVDDDGS